MEIELIVETCLLAMFKKDVFNEKLYLKGGQALRLAENIKSRFSADIDFSVADKITNVEQFESQLTEALTSEFSSNGLALFDLKFEKRPKIKRDGTPDFWGGWQTSFKLIEKSKEALNIEQRRREAIVPTGAASSIIKLDISEYEYCDSIEKIKLHSVEVLSYSRVLLCLEKIRALCQQHTDYPYKGNDARARDYYDIERLWNKVLVERKVPVFIEECKRHIKGVFAAKGVSLDLLAKIFEPAFIEAQMRGWPSVQTTVSGKIESFDYYVETLKDILSRINAVT